MKSYGVTIQMKATEQYFPVVLFIMLYKVVLTFESVDEILWCDHSNETSSAVLSHGTIYCWVFYQKKIWYLTWILILGTLRRQRVKVNKYITKQLHQPGCSITWQYVTHWACFLIVSNMPHYLVNDMNHPITTQQITKQHWCIDIMSIQFEVRNILNWKESEIKLVLKR